MNIVEFIAARLEEDEALAARVVLLDEDGELTGRYMLTLRVVAEVAAKRAIMAEHSDTHECSGPGGGLTFDPALQEDDWGGPCNTLCHLALPYAGHADYSLTWRP